MLPPHSQPPDLEYQLKVLDDGQSSVKSKLSEPQAVKDDKATKSTTRKISSLSSMQSALLTPKKMTKLRKLNFYCEHTQKGSWLKKLDPDSILNGESLSLFWNEFIKVMSDALSAPTPIGSSDLDSHWLSGLALYQDVNSWFNMNAISLANKNSLRISCPSPTAFLGGYTDCENTRNKSKKSYKKNPRNQTKKQPPNALQKIRIYPNKELHRIWKQWLAAYRWIYNWTIAKISKDGLSSAYDLQNQARAATRPNWVKELPGHQLQEAVADAVDAVKQAKANQGTAKFKSCRAYSQVIKFKVSNFKNGTWYCRLTKGLSFKSFQPLPRECIYGTQLVYQRGKWFACFPEYRPITNTDCSRVIALDPGNRTFLTGYDGETILEIGKKDIGRVNRLCSHLDQLMRKIAFSKVKRQRFKMRKAANRIRERIQNLVKDLHNKAASFLVRHYKLIFLPTFETSKMVLRSARKINSKTARNMLTWSHYKFARNLEQMANRNGVIVVRCNESYTSKTCPNCGHIHDRLGGSKVFRCPECGFTADRDANGARNIMLRALQATAFTVSGDAVLISDFSSNG